jgi:ABC-2 type transport system ATP-binding protein
MSIVQFNQVTKIFRVGFRGRRHTAVDRLSFSIDQPGVIGFIGPNGAGKTTSMKLMLGLVAPTRGAVAVRGVSCDNPRARQAVAFVPERPMLYPYLTVREMLRLNCDLYRVPAAVRTKRMGDAMERLGLIEHQKKKSISLSKGLQQRLSMASALLSDAELFVLDEPMSGMDPMGRRLFRDLIGELARAGKTVLFSTHVIDDVQQVCNRVIALARGRLVYDGSIGELLEAGYSGTEMVLDDVSEEQRNRLAALGCQVGIDRQGFTSLFSPAGQDLAEVQHLLFLWQIFPRSVARRCRPLESVLYPDACGGGDS